MDDLKTRQSRIRDLEVGRENLTLETYAHIDVGDMLLSRGADAGADMVVMGAYGHRRLRDLVLGGVTHHLL